jgi:hypothetical protein
VVDDEEPAIHQDDDRRRVILRAVALVPGYVIYRLQGDDRFTRGLLIGAGTVLILWGAIDLFWLTRGGLRRYFISDPGRARSFQYVLMVAGVVLALVGLVFY